jgi:SpoVK/Ycf46/Vps4 family AAA+-type ATPase
VEFGPLPRDPDRDASLVDLRHPERTRDEIVLRDDLRHKLDRIEDEYRRRAVFARHGLAPKSRLLFVGPPGCGKTLCAEVLASDLGLTLLYARFDGIISSYLGETATNLRRVFAYAAQHSSVLFLDEFDVLGKRRDDPHDVGELKRIIGSFLQILDSHPRDRIVVSATNHEGLLDEALWRRFDEVLYFGRPTVDQMGELIRLRLRAVRRRGVDVGALASRMKGFAFADAERVCFEAIKAMLLAERRELTQDTLLEELRVHRERLAVASGATSGS